ncbi:MAG: hypothetical protein WB624_20540 [Xanthobacteraceae bacterium]|jgi:hypothetical protein
MPRRLLTIGVVSIATTINVARADQLCGHSFNSIAQLYADIRKGGRIFYDFKTHFVIEDAQATWVFLKDSQPASPAALCRRTISVNGHFDTKIETRCNGEKSACDAFVAKYSGNDWRDAPQK